MLNHNETFSSFNKIHIFYGLKYPFKDQVNKFGIIFVLQEYLITVRYMACTNFLFKNQIRMSHSNHMLNIKIDTINLSLTTSNCPSLQATQNEVFQYVRL